MVDLGALGAAVGDSLQFRWEFGNDGCAGNLGWYVDDTAVYSCKVGGSGLPVSGGDPVPDDGGSGGATGGSSGGGALGWLLLGPMLGLALARRRRH